MSGNHLLFVYGSLRQGEQYHDVYLKAAEQVASQCWVRGKLVDTGEGYPALIPHDEGRVYGELYRITPEQLKDVDKLEGCRQNEPEYQRSLRPVMTDRGEAFEAEVYFYVQPFQHMPEVPFGDWRLRGIGERDYVLYFAYGSCMDDERFRKQGVEEKFLDLAGRGTLHGFRMRYPRIANDGGRADIVETGFGKVEGKVYRIDQEAVEYLYHREGVHTGRYRPALVTVEMDGQPIRDVLTFIVIDKSIPEQAPPEHYAREILRGSRGTVSKEYHQQLYRELKERWGMEVSY
ncbi:putative gamma-glutamylcyclotransferase YkqA [Marinithermofilum abyssi]|uniref:Putative gamma-glutamylcyclotransferase YkqA n=1 Tax=Marinithermofilum abyssi TaxID=1571185 RepID=A0A8J2VFH3_9BACL|nr:gamma-glutamylcyclotransferase family protein [Marinithermofilum abyssi]GGE08982.1 putative gamma-glutamylcyclotransferase YkqA [Marinithermofilum abyssi]